MAPSSSIASDETVSQRPRSQSDGTIDYSAQDYSTEHVSSGPQTELSADNASSIEPAAITTDGTHETLDQSIVSYEETNFDDASGEYQAPPTEQAWYKGVLVTADNAQAVFSPAACIFVANLDRTRSGTELADEVKSIFGQIGECWVKVRFDKKNIPAAFVQYKTIEEAFEADARFHGTLISGRPCRIKYARAPPWHYLRMFGAVDFWWTPCQTERALYNLPAGAFFRFSLFQPCQNALKTLTFTLAQLEKRKPALTAFNTILPEITPNAIYVGNLPYNVDENTLRMIFAHYGSITKVEVRKILHKRVAFAFIYYNSSHSAAMACQFPYCAVDDDHLSYIELKRVKPRRRSQPNYFDNLPNGVFRDGRDYTYKPGHPSCIPRYMRGNWPY
ncbi:unnamed protein product [Aureobasidium uvarum]|uniref:RRM domain-containing protein n=1 Tax=Aureobasidium uvarum TaxID=2773716 RepID=A0A9N8KEM9_9PEZI|nr:unnamed protein product [Aureobasidium uvarum]